MGQGFVYCLVVWSGGRRLSVSFYGILYDMFCEELGTSRRIVSQPALIFRHSSVMRKGNTWKSWVVVSSLFCSIVFVFFLLFCFLFFFNFIFFSFFTLPIFFLFPFSS